MDLKYLNKTIIAAIVQRPFADKGSTFCKLVPLFNHYDRFEKSLDPSEFYNDGEIWWKLPNSASPRSVVPGMMLEVTLERSIASEGDATKSLYQVSFMDRIDPLDPKCGAEVFTLQDEDEKSIRRFRGDGGAVRLAHYPCKKVFLRVGGTVYGPFATELSDPTADAVGIQVKIRPLQSNKVVYKIDALDFDHYRRESKRVCVALDTNVNKCFDKKEVIDYEYVSPEVAEQIQLDYDSRWTAMDFESLTAKVARVTNGVKVFSRSEKRQFNDLLAKLEDASSKVGDPDEFRSVFNGLSQLSADEEKMVRELAKVLIENRALNSESIDAAQREYLEDYIKTQSSTINEQLEAKRKELSEVEKQIATKKSESQLSEQRHRKAMEDAAAKSRRSIEDEARRNREKIELERKGWEDEKRNLSAELERKENEVKSILAEIQESAEKNVAHAVELFPYLKQVVSAAPQEETKSDAANDRGTAEAFAVPEILKTASPAATAAVEQVEFLERLHKYAESKGLSYDHDDLRRFHTSMLCESLTVLAGPSGVGKSSLARIYGEVLAGLNAEAPRDGMLDVHVSPTWMERADILGYVNTVTGDFSPSETGLYKRLIMAQEDYENNHGDSAVYPICLDEMNLSQVEHYFGDFMQVLEAPEDARLLPCFAREAVIRGSAFSKYAILKLPPSLRFVGTVNFDETTRRLSGRLLDRVNLVYLDDGGRIPLGATNAIDAGPGVSYATYAKWRNDSVMSLPSKVETWLEDLESPLKTLGIAVSPRVRVAMRKYIASSEPLIDNPAQAVNIAFDEQLAQRVLSKIRTVNGRKQTTAVNEIETILSEFKVEGRSPSQKVIERLRAQEGFFGFDLDNED